MKSTVRIYALCFFLIAVYHLTAQKNTIFSGHKYRLGFNYAYGPKAFGQELKEINYFYNLKNQYQVQLLKIQYYYAFHRRKTWGLDLLVQPQFNLTKYKHNWWDEEMFNGFECGINMGILLRKNIMEDFISYYASLSLGPHFTSNTPETQASGFIFSDNIFGGIDFQLKGNLYFDIHIGFRHISNAGLWIPNNGLNNIVMGCGIFVNLNNFDFLKSKNKKTT